MTIHELNSYEILSEVALDDIKSEGFILKHKKSGARICLISNDDENKVFYIGFRTTPTDETGVPHIIEHSTLCGSEKFPVKDPFNELEKGSLNTFLNAMTYPDKTVYPVASCNDQDFDNLIDVYMDAVLHPNITKCSEIFKQEGWHYEIEDVNDPITINGVVYNEMKGAYSSPEQVLQNQIFKSLFPDNTYSKNSGGNPLYIPSLTYDYYLEFYRKYYHPSNSYIYLYGDVDMAKKLEWLDKEYLSKYDLDEVDSAIAIQKPYSHVVELLSDYSVSADDDGLNQTYLAFNKVVGTALDKMLYQAFDILDYALVSSPGAPVKKALIDAGIGEDVFGSFDGGILQPVFSIIAKNTNSSEKEKFLQIIDSVLRDQVENGINKEALLAGINSSEFRFRESDFGQFPKGLLYGLQCLDSWLFDDMKPFIHLECLDTFAELKKLIDTDYYEKLVQEYLLDNNHGSVVIVEPKPGKNDAEEEELEAKLAELKASMSEEEILALIKATKDLKEYQEAPSSEEDLKKIPMITREDIKKNASEFNNVLKQVGGVDIVLHDVNSNGINYITFMFDSCDIPIEDIGYLGLLSSVLGYIDTEKYAYADLANAVNIYTGGISDSLNTQTCYKDGKSILVHYEFRVKSIEDNLEKCIELLDQVIRFTKFDNVKRLSEIIAQTKARLQVSLSSAGHTVSAMRSLSSFSENAYYSDSIHGIRYYRFICDLEKKLNENPQMVVSKLEGICKKLFVKNRLIVSFTSLEESFAKAIPVLEAFFEGLQEGQAPTTKTEIPLLSSNEGFTDNSKIQYVAMTGDYSKNGFEYTGIFRVLKAILSRDFLWNNVRVLGGAYGCMCAFLRGGESYFVSYRDPNLDKTLDVYKQIPEYIRNFNPDERDMTKYVIGTFSDIDTPMNPEAKGNRSMNAYLEGLSYEQIQRERDSIRNATAEDIRKLANAIEEVLKQNNICVLGNDKMIKDAADKFDVVEKLFS